MPRVGKIELPEAKVSLPVNFNLKYNRFSCTYAGKRYQATEFQALQKEVLQAVKATYELEWLPVIQLMVSSGKGPAETGVMFQRGRSYIGHHPDLGYRQVHWSASEEGRLASSYTFYWYKDQFSPPTKIEEGPAGIRQTTIYLPYSDETWAYLEEIATYLEVAAKALQKALATPEGVDVALYLCQRLFDRYNEEKAEPDGE
jgi:hypothetical protein